MEWWEEGQQAHTPTRTTLPYTHTHKHTHTHTHTRLGAQQLCQNQEQEENKEDYIRLGTYP